MLGPGQGSILRDLMLHWGILQAVHAWVPEPVLFLQSGHGSGFKVRSFRVPEDTQMLYKTAWALRI